MAAAVAILIAVTAWILIMINVGCADDIEIAQSITGPVHTDEIADYWRENALHRANTRGENLSRSAYKEMNRDI